MGERRFINEAIHDRRTWADPSLPTGIAPAPRCGHERGGDAGAVIDAVASAVGGDRNAGNGRTSSARRSGETLVSTSDSFYVALIIAVSPHATGADVLHTSSGRPGRSCGMVMASPLASPPRPPRASASAASSPNRLPNVGLTRSYVRRPVGAASGAPRERQRE
jgi:hypothetical protein